MGICTLVFGGTAILRPATETLAGHGLRVTVLARGTTDGSPQVIAAAVDVRDMPAIDDAIAGLEPFELALVSAPFAPATLIEAVAKRVSDRLIYVLTSR
jgi:hypothetical protein